MVQGKEFVKQDIFLEARLADGEKLTLYTDVDKLRAELLGLAPEDKDVIESLIKDMRSFALMDIPVDIGLGNMFSALSFARMFRKYSMTAKDFSRRFKSPKMRELFDLAFSWNEQLVAFPMWSAASIGSGIAAYPMGGSLPLTRALEQRYRSLGGEIQFKARVSKILVENDHTVGVKLEDGSEQRADIILSAMDGHQTLFNMLEGKYVGPELKKYYEIFKPFPPFTILWAGVKGTYDVPHGMRVKLKTPIEVGTGKVDWIHVNHSDYDPSMAPPGCSVYRIMFEADYGYWEALAKDKKAYLEEKRKLQAQLLEAMDSILPNFSRKVEVADLATPTTFVRFTGNYHGSYQGWQWTKESSLKQLPKKLPALQGFYMAGHWTSPGGGLPGAALSAYAAIKLLCKDEGKKFVAQEPK